MLSVPVLSAASRPVTVIVLLPDCRVIPEMDQLVVPDAEPEPPLLLTQLTSVTPTLSEAVPPRVMVLLEVE